MIGLSVLVAFAGLSTEAVAPPPVKVYILSGQSNMVGIGQVTSGGKRWGAEFIEPVVSVYAGSYDEGSDYDAMEPIETAELPAFGGTKPTPYPVGGTRVVRGTLQVEESGLYELRPGYGGSSYNVMEVGGREVYRREVGGRAVHHPIELLAGEPRPFKVTYLTEEANGLGWIARVDIPGTLHTVVKRDGRFPHLLDDDGHWAVRDDVWYTGLITARANGWLTVGCGAGANKIGPELQFGHVLGDHHDEPVLVLKSSQGNRSLGWDFLPPGSERYEVDGKNYAGYKDSPSSWDKGTTPEPIEWYAGKQYDDCFGAVHDVLDRFGERFPQWEDRGYEVAGFAWWQGHKDGNPVHAARYEENLVRFIKTVRREFDAPDAPFVIATIGFDGWEMKGPHRTVAEAQLAVSGERGKYPEFRGNVLTVETRGFWMPADVSPRNQGFHYHQNAEVYLRVGGALGEGMVRLLRGE